MSCLIKMPFTKMRYHRIIKWVARKKLKGRVKKSWRKTALAKSNSPLKTTWTTTFWMSRLSSRVFPKINNQTTTNESNSQWSTKNGAFRTTLRSEKKMLTKFTEKKKGKFYDSSKTNITLQVPKTLKYMLSKLFANDSKSLCFNYWIRQFASKTLINNWASVLPPISKKILVLFLSNHLNNQQWRKPLMVSKELYLGNFR